MPKNSLAIPTMMVELLSPEVQDRNVYKCLSCNYLFGNLSDLKRHLKLRHHVEVKNLNSMEVVPSEVSGILSYFSSVTTWLFCPQLRRS